MEVDSFVGVEESQCDVNETVVEDSMMLEEIYDDVALTNRMDDDSYCHTSPRRNHEVQQHKDQRMIEEKIRTQDVLDLEDRRREKRGKKEWKELRNIRAKDRSL
ncbi:hypothetical protein Tco_0231574 [Tanacetum coccineum]